MGNQLGLCEDRLLESAFTESASECTQAALETHWQLVALEIPTDELLEPEKDVTNGIRHLASVLKRTAEVVVVATVALYKATLESSASDSESSDDSVEEDVGAEPSDLIKKMDFSSLE